MQTRPWTEILQRNQGKDAEDRTFHQKFPSIERPRTYLPQISNHGGYQGTSYKVPERTILEDVKNRRIKPRSRLLHGLHESPKQRFKEAFRIQGQSKITVHSYRGNSLLDEEVRVASPKEIKHVVQEYQDYEYEDRKETMSPFTITNHSYEMNSRPRGYAIVINNYDFYKEMIALTEHGPQMLKINQKALRRDGSIVDADKLVSLFRDELQFIVRAFSNLTAHEMVRVLDECRKKDHTNFDCFVCCIASHGRKGSLFGSDCRELRISDITAMYSGMRCVTLSGKPKCFFLQGCSGNHTLKGIMSGSVMPHGTRPEANYFIPQTSDFIIGYSLLKDCTSFRGGHDESLFYQAIVKYTQRHRYKSDVINIMSRVKKFLKKKRERVNEAQDIFQCNFRALMYLED